MTDPAEYATNHWRRCESDAEHRARVDAADAFADGLWGQAHAAIIRRRDNALSTCNHIHLRASIRRTAQTQIDLINIMRDEAADHHMRTGQDLPPDMDRAWLRVIDPERAAEFWPDDLATEMVAQVRNFHPEVA